MSLPTPQMNKGKPHNPTPPATPSDETREPEQPKRKYKFDAANRDPRFYEELMQLMEFGQNDLYTRY